MKRVLFLLGLYMTVAAAQDSFLDQVQSKMQKYVLIAKCYAAKLIVTANQKKDQLEAFCAQHENTLDAIACACVAAAAVYLSAKYWSAKKAAKVTVPAVGKDVGQGDIKSVDEKKSQSLPNQSFWATFMGKLSEKLANYQPNDLNILPYQ